LLKRMAAIRSRHFGETKPFREVWRAEAPGPHACNSKPNSGPHLTVAGRGPVPEARIRKYLKEKETAISNRCHRDGAATLEILEIRLFLGIATLVLIPCGLTAQVIIDSVAGGTIRSGVPAQQVVLGTINSMAFDPQGNLVFADSSRDAIRRIRPDGVIETIAGTGVSGFAGDGGPAITALLHYPTFLEFDPSGNLYFVDAGNNRIRRIDPTGTITTAAGTGVLLAADDPPDSPRIGKVAGLAIDKSGNVYFSETSAVLANGPRSWVRRLRPSGAIEAFAGTGATRINDIFDSGVAALSAQLDFPSFLAFDSAGNLYIVESGFNLDIVQVSPDGVLKKFASGNAPLAVSIGNAIGASSVTVAVN